MKKHRELTRNRAGKARSVRRRLRGNAEKPRLSVFRSSHHIYCQAIDDESGRTLCSADSRRLSGSVSSESCIEGGQPTTKRLQAEAVGKSIASDLLGQGVKTVVFDRGWYPFHGRVKALADSARASGLKF